MLTVKGVFSGMITCYPTLTKSAEEATEALKDFKGNRKVDVVYSDNAGELVKAAEAIKAKTRAIVDRSFTEQRHY